MNASNPDFKLIIGLGNPDKRYENTYHNVGHLFIDYLQKNYTLYPIPYTLKTDVYMNESGKYVYKIIKKTNAKPESLLVIHDDSDILLGNYKLSFNRGSAGHKGIENVIKILGTQKLWRLRIGIRPLQKEGAPRLKAEKFVLKKITVGSEKILNNVFQKIAAELFR